MTTSFRALLNIEQLESRIVPSVSRAIGTLQIKDTTANYEWASADQSFSANVIGTDVLRAALDVTYTLTKKELASAKTQWGYMQTRELVQWLEMDFPDSDDVLSERGFKVKFNFGPGVSSETIVIRFGNIETNDSVKDGNFNDAEHQGWFDEPSSVDNYQTKRINLFSVGAPGPNTNGNPPNNPLGTTSANLTETQLSALPSPDLPALAAGQSYRLLTFDSQNGTDFTFRAANSSGYGLFAASSPDLIIDPAGDGRDRILGPSATLAAVYPNGSPYAGAYNGTNKDFVVRSAGDQTHILSGYSYSKLPTALLALPDGQTVTVPGAAIEDGDEVLWLFYDTGAETIGFVVAATDLPTPKLSISDATVTEGNSGTANANFVVSLSAPALVPVTVNYSTTPGTATSPSDFASTSGTLTFFPGETNKAINVPVSGDTVYEFDEDFFVNLGSATAASIVDGVGQGTIVNDDAVPSIVIGDVSSVETNSGTTSFNFPVTLSHSSEPSVTVAYSTTAGTAGSPSDYTAVSGTLTFAGGQTSMTISAIVNGDTVPEEHETFSMSLSSPVNATLNDATGLGMILNDDQQPTISIMATPFIFVPEGNSGTTTFSFSVSLSSASAQTITVDYATADGSATAGSDYEAKSGTLTFAPQETSKTITVTIYGDTTYEDMESFAMNLSNPVNATFSFSSTNGYISNDD